MTDPERLVANFEVRIAGGKLPQQAASSLVSVTVCQDVSAPGMFELRLINRDEVTRKITWSDDDLFAAGKEVEIRMGHVGEKQELVMVGEITGIEPEFQAGEAMLTVRGYDRRHRLLHGRKTRSFAKLKDSEIASQVAEKAKLTLKAEDTKVTHDYVLQHNQTDWEFLQERAWRLGFEVAIDADGKTLKFQPHRNDGPEVLTLALDADLIEFRPRLSTLDLIGEMVVQGWDPKQKKAITGKASAGAAYGPAVDALIDHPVSSPEEAEQIAKGQLQEMALSYFTGEGIAKGCAALKAGSVIRIAGCGIRFSGPYYLSSVCHTWLPKRGYRTAFTVRRKAQ